MNSMKKTLAQLQQEKYTDDAIDALYVKIMAEVKKDFAIKLAEVLIFAFCGIILAGFVYAVASSVGWKLR